MESAGMKNPILSVIIPAYNCEHYLSECLESVLVRMPEECELIIVDDGSSDSTPGILESYRHSCGSIRILLREHKGASGARNAGLSAAEGEYVTFLDCDDCLADHFLEKAFSLLRQDAGLLIFGIERVYLSGRSECWTLRDRVYDSISDFADEYIRTREMLIYSNCNKFYRRKIIEKAHLRFDESVDFGEDRLFNYRYLCLLERQHQKTAVITSQQIMLRYIQRSAISMSAKSVPHYFDRVMELHRAKTETFLSLSQGTSDEERRTFCARDLGSEIMQTVDRFALYPQEEEENLPGVNALIFGRFPSLRNNMYNCGIPDPAYWYRSQTGRQLVIDCLRTFTEEET